MTMCVDKINTFSTELVKHVVWLSKIVKNVTTILVSNVNQNISENKMEQLAHYADLLWLDVKSAIILFSVQDVLMVTLWNKIEMVQLYCLMEIALNVIQIVLLAIRREFIVQVVIVDIHWVQQELVFQQINSILLYYWILISTFSHQKFHNLKVNWLN